MDVFSANPLTILLPSAPVNPVIPHVEPVLIALLSVQLVPVNEFLLVKDVKNVQSLITALPVAPTAVSNAQLGLIRQQME